MRGDSRCKSRGSWLHGQHVFEFAKLPPGSRVQEVWLYPGDNSHCIQQADIAEPDIERWLQTGPPTRDGHLPIAGLRLLEATSAEPKEHVQLSRETLELFFHTWGLSQVEVPLIQLYAGGLAVRNVESRGHAVTNCVVGGLGSLQSSHGIFSYDSRTNVTTGFLISGTLLPKAWTDEIPHLFLQMPHPLTVVLAMAEISMHLYFQLTEKYRSQIPHVEDLSKRTTNAINPSQDHRSLANEVGFTSWIEAQMRHLLDRCRIRLCFVLKQLEDPESPFRQSTCNANLSLAGATLLSRAQFCHSSLEPLNLKSDMYEARAQAQKTILANLVAQQDLNVSLKIAKDSKEVAEATRQDSSVMRSIAILGTVFLPANLVATFLAIPVLYRSPDDWEDGVFSSRVWMYFAIAVPLTMITVAGTLLWLRRTTRKQTKSAREEEGFIYEDENKIGNSTNGCAGL